MKIEAGGMARGYCRVDIRREQIRLVAKQLPVVFVANVINPTLVAFVLSATVPPGQVILWSGLLILLTLFRFVQLRRMNGVLSAAPEPGKVVARLAAGAGLSGCIWGFGLALLLPDPLIHRFFVVFVLGGMAAGSAVTLAPLLQVVSAFLLPCMLPLGFRLLLIEDGPVHAAMGALTLLFTVGMWAAAFRLNGWICEILQLKMEKTRLADELAAALDNLEWKVEQRTTDLSRARDAADRANEAKTRLLAAASHDLGQPFQAMRLFIDLLDKHLAGNPNHTYVRSLAQAHESGERMLAGLLDLSRLETGAIQVRTEPFPVKDLLARLDEEFRPLAENRGLDFRVRPVDAVIVSDPVLLHQIIGNLLANALRYTPRGGVLLGCRRRGGCLSIEVWDTGIGIPADRLDEIFEEFRRLDQADHLDFKGVGLGLSIVRRTAALLGHRVTVRSRPGRGSVFSVTAPLAPART